MRRIYLTFAPDSQSRPRRSDSARSYVFGGAVCWGWADLGWFDAPFGHGLSADGKLLLFDEEGSAGGADGTVYVRQTDGSPAVRLGEGIALAVSPDGRRVLARLRSANPPRLFVMPTGVGEPKPLPNNGINFNEFGRWFPDSRRVLLNGNEPDHKARAYVQDVETGQLQPVTPEGINGLLVSPDGKFLIVGARGQKRAIMPVGGGDPRPIDALGNDDLPITWSQDGRALYVSQGVIPIKLYRLDLATGRREFIKEIAPGDPAGVLWVGFLSLTPDGKSYEYTVERDLSTLFTMSGVK